MPDKAFGDSPGSKARQSYLAELIRETRRGYCLRINIRGQVREVWFPKRCATNLGDGRWELSGEWLDRIENDGHCDDYLPLWRAVVVREAANAWRVAVRVVCPDGCPRSRAIWLRKDGNVARVEGRNILARRWLICEWEEKLRDRNGFGRIVIASGHTDLWLEGIARRREILGWAGTQPYGQRARAVAVYDDGGGVDGVAYGAWLRVARHYVTMALMRRGAVRTHTSRVKGRVRSTYWAVEAGGETWRVRVSDHRLPDTKRRAYGHRRGWQKYDYEIVLDQMVEGETLDRWIEEATGGLH